MCGHPPAGRAGLRGVRIKYLGLANLREKVYIWGMEIEGGSDNDDSVEKAETGLSTLNTVPLDERGSARPSTTRVVALALGFLTISTIAGYALGLKLDGVPLDQFFSSVIDKFNSPSSHYLGHLTVWGEMVGGIGAMAIITFGLKPR